MDRSKNICITLARENEENIDELFNLIAELTKRVEKLEDRAGLARGRRDKTIVEIK